MFRQGCDSLILIFPINQNLEQKKIKYVSHIKRKVQTLQTYFIYLLVIIQVLQKKVKMTNTLGFITLIACFISINLALKCNQCKDGVFGTTGSSLVKQYFSNVENKHLYVDSFCENKTDMGALKVARFKQNF